MRMCSIASGSSGNCIYIGDSDTHLLVDAGISAKRIEEGLAALQLSPRDLSGILVTHEHSDHISSLGVLARRYALPIYTTGGTADWIIRKEAIGKVDPGLFRELESDRPFQIGSLRVEAFDIPHDAAQPVGYRVSSGGKSCAVATDLGRYSEYIQDHLYGLDAVLLEANHDLRMLQVGPYPYQLKLRIMGDRGHLSNDSCGELLGRILHDGLRTVFLGHLSKENNYAELAFETVCQSVTQGDNPYQARDFDIRVASRTEMTPAAEF